MKQKKKLIGGVILVVVIAILAVAGKALYDLMFGGSVTVKSGDVIAAIKACKVPLIVGGIIIVAGIALLIASKIVKEDKTKLILKAQGPVAILLSVVMTVTWICTGVEYSNITAVLSKSKELDDETKGASVDVSEKIAEEGITLLKNEDNALPLKNTKKLNVFGWSSTHPVYAGTGSGATSEDACVSLLQGIEDAGFEVNQDLVDFYNDFCDARPTIGMETEDFTVPEPTIKEYEEKGIFDNAKEYSDTAVVVLSRSGGEGGDLPMSLSKENNYTLSQQGKDIVFSTQEDDLAADKSYLELTNRESAMMDRVCKEFDNVIVVVNSNNTMELGFLDEYDSIKAAIWCPGAGEKGFDALGKILNGEVNPSGHLVDTWVYDLLDTPTSNNFGSYAYEDYADVTGGEEYGAVFVNYVENIYVGYKYWETAAAEGSINYEDKVQFPFGYGLSYTTFEQKITDVQDDGETIKLEVSVTNTGDTAGKDAVELYYTPPYYNGGIEKASTNLVEFAKTDMIEPGETQKIELEVSYEDMASYDSEKIKTENGGYVLESGDYSLNVCDDAHTINDTYSFNVKNDTLYSGENKRSTDETAAENVFDYAKGDVTYLSRKDSFANYEEATAAPTDFSMSAEAKENYTSRVTFNADDYDSDDVEMPVTGADNGLTIQDMTGLDWDDEKWESLLDELSVDELKSLVADAGYHTVAVDSINMGSSNDSDGPAGINSFLTGAVGTSFPVPVMIAATWNTELAYERGQQLGKEGTELGITGWYGPAMDTHRSAFSGRNFEYYSEDGVLSGKMAAQDVKGAQENGLIAFIKHFALNDSETDRTKNIATWTTEQAAREIYLKPFEIAVKEGGARGVMASMNAIGTKWAGSNPELLTDVLRDEWGFVGCVVTDALDSLANYYEDPNEAVRCGVDKMLAFTVDDNFWYDESAGTVTALRNAAHNYLYALANSNAVTKEISTPGWVYALYAADAVLVLIAVAIEINMVRKMKKKEEN